MICQRLAVVSPILLSSRARTHGDNLGTTWPKVVVSSVMYDKFVLAKPNSTKEITRGVLGAVVRESLRLAHRRYRIKSRPIDLSQTLWTVEISDFGNLPENWGVGFSFVSPSQMFDEQAEEVLLYRLGQKFMKHDEPPWGDLEIWLASDWDERE